MKAGQGVPANQLLKEEYVKKFGTDWQRRETPHHRGWQLPSKAEKAEMSELREEQMTKREKQVWYDELEQQLSELTEEERAEYEAELDQAGWVIDSSGKVIAK